MLNDTSLDLASHMDSDQVLVAILEEATSLLDAQSGILKISDQRAPLVHGITAHNIPTEHLSEALRACATAVDEVMATGRPSITFGDSGQIQHEPASQDSPYNAVLSVPLRWQGQVLGVLIMLDRKGRRSFTEEDVHLLSVFAGLACMAIKNAEVHAEAMRAGQQLTDELARHQAGLNSKTGSFEQLFSAMLRIQEEERNRIARDLHDGSSQLLAGTLYEIQAAEESILNHRLENALEKLKTTKGILRKIEAENRRIISGLSPPILEASGLGPAIKWHATHFQEHHRIPCSVQFVGQPTRLSPEAESAAYRIVQEALNNVASHAQAKSVQIHIGFLESQVRVIVQDDGVGFDPGSNPASITDRMGLIGMRERARRIGAQLDVQSSPGQGTRVILDVPLSTESVP